MSPHAANGDAVHWDGFQREALAAMGYRVWQVADASPQPPDETSHGMPSHDAQSTRVCAGDDALRSALARAAGVASTQLPDDVALASLRGDAAQKRALWPRLRAMRRIAG